MSASLNPNDTSRPAHYGRPHLGEALLAALTEAGKEIDNLAPDDLAPFENLHVRSRAATRDLAQLACIRPGARVLHVGCGIGGPARTLAVEYGCHVTGIDITESYVEAGRMLVERVGLIDAVSLFEGNALDLPFDEESFDVVWMQHVSMNVLEKGRLYREARRVLRHGGRLALHEIHAGMVFPPHYPVPWASDPSTSFLVSPHRLRATIADSGFLQAAWQDDTPKCIEWARRPLGRVDSLELSSALDALLGPDYRERIQNIRRNLIEGRTEVVQAVYTTA